MNNGDRFLLKKVLKEAIRRIKRKFKKLFCLSVYFGAIAVILFALVILSSPSSGQTYSPVFIDVFQERSDPFLAVSLSVRESPDLTFIQKNTLMAVSPPTTVTPQILGALTGSADYEIIEREITKYMVESGDTLDKIAQKFGISQDTIRWANNLQGSTIQPGKELIILPVSGVLHVVRKNDTLSEIASWYRADMKDIMMFNDLALTERIVVGDLLIIPNVVKPTALPHNRLAFQGLYPPTGRPYIITQGFHHYNAIDFGAPCGAPVYAAETGTVQRVGYGAIGGNYIRILHPNGVVTYYGHLAPGGILVSPGQSISRGERIGLVGMTGFATGCHVHFEVRGASNPFIQ